jgi:isopentenyl-diphosphate delta-isomerase
VQPDVAYYMADCRCRGDDLIDQVTLLHNDARPAGRMPKLAAHRPPGHAHLAFSVLLWSRARDAVLMQRRSGAKDLFAGRWGNTCCSHPTAHEPIEEAARRRLAEELGIVIDARLRPWAGFWYCAADPSSGLVEIEYDVVLVGQIGSHVEPLPDPTEVQDVAWIPFGRAFRLAGTTDVAPWLDGVLRAATGPRQLLPPHLPGMGDRVLPSDDGASPAAACLR